MYIDTLGLWAVGDSQPQPVVDFSAGLGDAMLLGTGRGRKQVRSDLD
ncbi:MAG: hypothetical protein V4757_23175 [Pseudomonadota bacterium]